jgi:hypothetical protein
MGVFALGNKQALALMRQAALNGNIGPKRQCQLIMDNTPFGRARISIAVNRTVCVGPPQLFRFK